MYKVSLCSHKKASSLCVIERSNLNSFLNPIRPVFRCESIPRINASVPFHRQGESNRLVWNFTDISQHSDNGGVDTLRARLEVGTGPSNPAIISTQFNCEGTTLSGIEFELVGTGYRLSLVKRRFVSGELFEIRAVIWSKVANN